MCRTIENDCSTWRILIRCSNASLMVLLNVSFLQKLSSHILSRFALNSNKLDTISLSFSSSMTILWPVLRMYWLSDCLNDSRAFTLEKSIYILWRSSIRFPSISSMKPCTSRTWSPQYSYASTLRVCLVMDWSEFQIQ